MTSSEYGTMIAVLYGPFIASCMGLSLVSFSPLVWWHEYGTLTIQISRPVQYLAYSTWMIRSIPRKHTREKREFWIQGNFLYGTLALILGFFASEDLSHVYR